MFRLIRELIRPYRGKLLIILAGHAGGDGHEPGQPWPLKIIIDNVVEQPQTAAWVGRASSGLCWTAAISCRLPDWRHWPSSLIALFGAVASYIDNYYTESVGQWVAHDLRMRTYHHLQRLSLGYYNTHQTGTLLSTITTDIETIQDFASSSTLDILIDLLTIVSMLGLMFWLNWDFTLIAVAVTPFLLFFISRFKKAVKKATHQVRKEESEIVAVVQQGLESMQVIEAFGRQDMEQEALAEVSHATVNAALKARKVKSLLSPIVTITVAFCTAIVLWRGAALILQDVMTVGALNRLPLLPHQVL